MKRKGFKTLVMLTAILVIASVLTAYDVYVPDIHPAYLVSLVVIFLISAILSHAPIYRLTEKEKQAIIENGLVHYTSEEKALRIQEMGFLGYKTHMGFPETLLGEMIWFYPNEREKQDNEHHKYLQKTSRVKDEPKRFQYQLTLKVKEEDFKHLYVRHGWYRDPAVTYRGASYSPEIIEVKKMNE